MMLSNKINDQILIVFLIDKNILVSSFFICLDCQNNSCGMIKIDFFEMHLYISTIIKHRIFCQINCTRFAYTVIMHNRLWHMKNQGIQ